MRELEDITTLSDTHKRFIVVNDGSITSELTERLIADIKRGMQSNEIPAPMFTPVNETENFIYGNDKYVLGPDGKHYCRACRCVQSPWEGSYSHFSGCVHLIKEFDILNNGYVDDVPPGEIEDNKTIEKRDLVICFILLVVAAITIAAHWIFGG